MKTIFAKNKILLLIFGVILISTPCIIMAATSSCPEGYYQFETGIPLIPGAGKGECLAPSGLSNLLISLIKLLSPIAGVLAFVMIVVAGFEYAASGGDINRQKDAQDRIVNAIIGLVLLFAFWIILNTINPDLLKVQDLSLEPISSPVAKQVNMTKLNDSNIPLSWELLQGPAYVNFTLGDLLQALFINTYYTKNKDGIYEPRANPIEWYITEACITSTLPCKTTYAGHEKGSCHYDGTCVDIVLKDESKANQQEFIKIAKSRGLSIYNEYDPDCWVAGTTGGHFHVALTCGGSGSCWICP